VCRKRKKKENERRGKKKKEKKGGKLENRHFLSDCFAFFPPRRKSIPSF
jgi:hypothetical protein